MMRHTEPATTAHTRPVRSKRRNYKRIFLDFIFQLPSFKNQSSDIITLKMSALDEITADEIALEKELEKLTFDTTTPKKTGGGDVIVDIQEQKKFYVYYVGTGYTPVYGRIVNVRKLFLNHYFDIYLLLFCWYCCLYRESTHHSDY